ncbi:AraC family transcriptional regulator [Aquimarina atlantica]|uniref:AraC family transcriptional regulator n=1 Tax=Aquimarina atlantica TaxID=1317122 RepID=A0A023BPW9_9FLAO|nr:AraC family transcriptional regulator [Aquimarina atlantica]EZH71748.1 AraC family transcriptional regulator [Aquimarina atlantica]
MNKLNKGEFFGSHKQKVNYDQLIITDTEYTHEKVDWHYHENPYFTYLLQGKLFESNKKESYHLTSGSLLFHNWQDAHFNIKPPVYTRGFHIELNADWFNTYELSSFDFEGSIKLQNPMIKEAMNKIFMETKVNDDQSKLSIELLLLDVFGKIHNKNKNETYKIPTWVRTLKDIIHEEPLLYNSLTALAKHLNIHPSHLSRDFPKYFDSTLGQYIRKQKVNKAVSLLADKSKSLTDICYECEFYDQSHFIYNFKNVYGITPSKFRKEIL